MATTAVPVPPGAIIVGKPKWRPLESEGNLAMLLLLPTVALLGMFIAYPFVRGILLAVTNSKVGQIGEFDAAAACKNHGVLDHIAQLSQIAGPGVALERGVGLG